ncbi:hypothetical protein CEXT_569721 [Caerostris extrusa]|uniref:Uncharacterized protein n=1 Tax=Caerostris extrusa TaxID=172846 RepID=A0AAV4XBM0_CAEEX|nr:hypothetical protein CEXT_569721 [Caerostris extrusa]
MHFRSQQSHFAERHCNMPVPQDASIASSFPGLQSLVPESNRINPVRLQEIRSFLNITTTSHSTLTTFLMVLRDALLTRNCLQADAALYSPTMT